jgi:hypothetical protein
MARLSVLMVGEIGKPFNAADLTRKVREVLDSATGPST